MRETRAKVLFIEVSNDNPEFLKQQYKKMAHSAPDYAGVADADAVRKHTVDILLSYDVS